jgi:C_GCAxxG_C_C family probable redox protein
MKSKIETAVQRFTDGYSCAQAVFTSYAPSYGVRQADALRIATGFGGGMGHLQEVCGAVTGAFMVIGSCCGMRQPADKAGKDRTYDLVHELGKRFATMHGSILCRGLLDCDLNTEEGKAQFKEQKLRETKCSVYVRDACRLLEEMLPAQAAD